MDKKELIQEFDRRNIVTRNSFLVLKEFVGGKLPFRLVLWNYDKWDKPLPKSIMQTFPHHLVLDVKNDTLKHSYVSEDEKVIIVTEFNGEIYTKEIRDVEIYAITDFEANCYVLNLLPNIEDIGETDIDYIKEKTQEQKSISAFKNNNKNNTK